MRIIVAGKASDYKYVSKKLDFLTQNLDRKKLVLLLRRPTKRGTLEEFVEQWAFERIAGTIQGHWLEEKDKDPEARRSREMVENADALVVFGADRSLKPLVTEAKKRKLRIKEY